MMRNLTHPKIAGYYLRAILPGANWRETVISAATLTELARHVGLELVWEHPRNACDPKPLLRFRRT